ncbi:hypothetical protein AAHA92_33890 [Salvia divinorum]|uniref:Uncharacterized protein n=1 Tax=Salvia divinorum TaxID=28513 RepID=A0ABD1FHR2_SALDI
MEKEENMSDNKNSWDFKCFLPIKGCAVITMGGVEQRWCLHRRFTMARRRCYARYFPKNFIDALSCTARLDLVSSFLAEMTVDEDSTSAIYWRKPLCFSADCFRHESGIV